MERDISVGKLRSKALERIEQTLNCEKNGDQPRPAIRKPRHLRSPKTLTNSLSISEPMPKLSRHLGDLVCNGDSNAIFILRRLLQYSRIRLTGSEAAKLAERIQGKD
jgi:hypothetical protein